jgi:competence protein CoiA
MERNNVDAMRFALSPEARIVHIDDVGNGSKCECTCPACGGSLIAKNKGEIRTHHFAHDASIDGVSCSETALHRAAKQLVADHKTIRLPSPDLWPESSKQDYLAFSDVEVERRIDDLTNDTWIVADCLGIHDTGELLIEIAVRHHIDEDKLNKLQSLNMPAMEINLEDWVHIPWTWESLIDAVLNDSQRRHWAYLPEWFKERHFPEPEEVAAEIPNANKNQNEWIFPIGSIWVFVRDLPYGNVKVYHRPSHAVRQIVEPICRGHGYWNPKFKCWIVFDCFKQEILNRLATIKLSS